LNISNLSEKVLERIGAIIGQELIGSHLDLLGIIKKYSIVSQDQLAAV